MLHVILNLFLREFSSDKSLGIEDGVFGVSCDLILGGITNESFFFSEGNVRRSGVVSLIVGDDFHFIVEPHSYAGVGGS